VVIVNDRGVAWDGSGSSELPANQVVTEITKEGSQAIADLSDISSPLEADALVDRIVVTYGHIDCVINNAGIYLPPRPFLEKTYDSSNNCGVHRPGIAGGHLV
jgi:NAD(P)-dependent dehydrogenase (short-subunit alcohol dehydrogenase family)